MKGPGLQRNRRWILMVAAALLLAACQSIPSVPIVNPGPAASPTPAKPNADGVAAAYFKAWEQGRYEAMYDLLSSRARAAIAATGFVERHKRINDGLGVSQMSFQAQPAAPKPVPSPAAGTPTATPPQSAVAFQITRKLPIFGELTETNELLVVREGDDWKVDWQPGVIFKDLTDKATVRLTTDPAPRGRILDRNGKPLAEDGRILSVGVVPGEIKGEAALLKALSGTFKLSEASIKARYQGGKPDWFMPIADRPAAEAQALQKAVGSIPGIAFRDKTARVYPLGAAAAHVVGYVSLATADDLKRLAARGYEESDWVGRTGVEAWGEQYLTGQKGGILVVADESGQVTRTIAEKSPAPGADIQLALDADIQSQASKILPDRPSSLVVIDPRDGALLAVASHPTFDPNQLVIGLSPADLERLNQTKAFIFRASTQGYPTGSIFKVITMAAGLEKAGVKPADTFDCGLEWRGLPGVVLRNWRAEGVLDLIESLSQSCNPTFYTIGLKLQGLDPFILPGFARGFGLGAPTGVEGVDEIGGVVPDPTWKQQQVGQPWYPGDSVNLAIGQGYLLATPLQMANAYAALASGGTLRTPLLVKTIKRPDGTEQSFAAKEKGKLPISPQTRGYILEGMRRAAATANGTAYYAFRDERTPTAAKTGSAENEGPDAHAWFAGFMTPTEPKVVALAMVEGGQHGGTVAAPLARQMLDFAYPRLR